MTARTHQLRTPVLALVTLVLVATGAPGFACETASECPMGAPGTADCHGPDASDEREALRLLDSPEDCCNVSAQAAPEATRQEPTAPSGFDETAAATGSPQSLAPPATERASGAPTRGRPAGRTLLCLHQVLLL